MPFDPFLWGSSGGSSRSSGFVRLREEAEEEERLTAGRRGADSELGESGDFEALVDPEGALRLPDRRVSLGERGGPIVATWAMNVGRGRREGSEREREYGNLASSKRDQRILSLFRAGAPSVFPLVAAPRRLAHRHRHPSPDTSGATFLPLCPFIPYLPNPCAARPFSGCLCV